MKVTIERNGVSVTIDAPKAEATDAVHIAAVAREVMNTLDPPGGVKELPFGFAVWADTERMPEEVLADADTDSEAGPRC